MAGELVREWPLEIEAGDFGVQQHVNAEVPRLRVVDTTWVEREKAH